jgi:alpha-galactosidase
MLARVFPLCSSSKELGVFFAAIGKGFLLFFLTLASASASPSEGNANFKSCYASWKGDELVAGNSHFLRKWIIRDGWLVPVSFRNLDTGTEWLRPPQAGKSASSAGTPAGDGISITASGRRFLKPSEECLRVVVSRDHGALLHRIDIFPDVRGAMELFSSSSTRHAGQGDQKKNSRPEVDGTDDAERAAIGDDSDDSETLLLSPRHLRLTQVIFRDQTDAHNELVQEAEWMLLNEHNLKLEGNLFSIEDPVSREGLVLLKIAPLHHARPVKCDHDLVVEAEQRKFVFTGGGYSCVLLAYSGGCAGRTLALQDFQRQLRRYAPERDGLFLSNTWGDRARDAHLNEGFMLKEIDAAAKLGVDAVQIDDGWQKGRSANSATPNKKAWGTFWSQDKDFWKPDPERFPNGLEPLRKAACESGMKLGLWFGPDSSDQYSNWNRDATLLLKLHRESGIDCFKLDSYALRSTEATSNFRRMLDRLMDESAGSIGLDLDSTAGIRYGYFGAPDCGTVFVENRYTDTDWNKYWPHLTLRNLWQLSRYVDPMRLRMEFLNNRRNAEKYGDDPLAPARYAPDTLFATVMFSNPLGWFEVSKLPEEYCQSVKALVSLWKKERANLFAGRILPIGNLPDGLSWTGFASVPRTSGPGYLLFFRELNTDPEWSLNMNTLFSVDKQRVTRLSGKGTATVSGNTLTIHIPEKLNYLWLRVE